MIFWVPIKNLTHQADLITCNLIKIEDKLDILGEALEHQIKYPPSDILCVTWSIIYCRAVASPWSSLFYLEEWDHSLHVEIDSVDITRWVTSSLRKLCQRAACETSQAICTYFLRLVNYTLWCSLYTLSNIMPFSSKTHPNLGTLVPPSINPYLFDLLYGNEVYVTDWLAQRSPLIALDL